MTTSEVKKLRTLDVFCEYAKMKNKWCMYISFDYTESYDEVLRAAPYLNMRDDFQIMAEGCGLLEFDSQDECEYFFALTVGEDGPTDWNPYNGDVRVFALTISPSGELMAVNS